MINYNVFIALARPPLRHQLQRCFHYTCTCTLYTTTHTHPPTHTQYMQGGLSKLGNPVFYFIVRKFRADQRRASNQVFYHMISLLKARTEKVFELVIDLTQSTLINEPDVSLYNYNIQLCINNLSHLVHFGNCFLSKIVVKLSLLRKGQGLSRD